MITTSSADRIAGNPTSLFSLLSCAGIPCFALTSWAMGLLGDHVGLNRAFFLVPVLFAVFVALLLCERRGSCISAECAETTRHVKPKGRTERGAE